MTAAEWSKVPPVECAPWCEYGDGHPNERFAEDQKCWSPATYIDMSLRPVQRDSSGEFPESLGVMARRDDKQTVVYLHLRDIKIGEDDGPRPWPYNYLDDSLHLTADEAVALAEALLASADIVRKG